MSVSAGVVDEFVAAVDKLVEVDPAVLADSEAVVGLHRQLERMLAVTTRATATFDASGAWQPDGARTAAAWLATKCRLPMTTAQRRVRLGRTLRHLPLTDRAWLAGDIGEAQVGVLARARTEGTAEALARDEELLVGEATRLRFASFARVVAYWGLRADPDGAESSAEAQREERRLHLCACGPTASRACGSSTGSSIPSRAPSWPASSSASTPSCSTPTGPKPRPASVTTWG